MKVTIVGTGYVGLTLGGCLAEIGHHVMCVDLDAKKIEELKQGVLPIYEPGLEDIVKRNYDAGRLLFSTDISDAIRFAEIVFSAVGTPPDKDHRADLSAVKAVAGSFAEHADAYKIFVNKSTVPVGTGEACKKIVTEIFAKRGVKFGYDQVSNPEFLREGVAVSDCLKPDRIVVGTESSQATEMMRKLYLPIIEKGAAFFATDIKSAEIIKYAANTFLATKISFMNEIARFCELVGADVTAVAQGIGSDTRIGRRFLHAGIGYGGSCFPKDVDALMLTGEDVGYHFDIISAVQKVNSEQKQLAVKKLKQLMPDCKGKKIALWGLSFKPKTDDMREAPALVIIKQLLELGALLYVYDPVAMDNCKSLYYPELNYGKNAMDVIKDAEALIVVTEWDEFRGVDIAEVKKVMRGNVIIDGRNIWQPEEVRKHGFVYTSIGRQ